MMYLAVHTLLLAAAGTTVFAKCYKSGDEGNKVTALNNLDAVCRGMEGSFFAGQSRSACVSKAGEDTYWYFEMLNNKDVHFLDIPYCKKRLEQESQACSRGGQSDADDWFARADPGRGACHDIDVINARKEKRGDLTMIFDGPKKPAHVEAGPRSLRSRKSDTKVVFDVTAPIRDEDERRSSLDA